MSFHAEKTLTVKDVTIAGAVSTPLDAVVVPKDVQMTTLLTGNSLTSRDVYQGFNASTYVRHGH